VWDAFTPVEEVVQALDDLVRSGKVRYAGISDTPAWVVSEAVTLADLRGWTRFAGLQVPYSLLWRDIERDLLPMAHALDLTVTTWEPLGSGLLTGRYGSDREAPEGTRITTTTYRDRLLTDRNLAIADAVNEVAAQRGVSSAQVAIAWVRAQQQRAVIIPIVGARTREHIEDSLGAVDVELSDEEVERLDEVSRIELGFPHDFEGRTFAHGATFDLVDDHRGNVYTEVGPPPMVTADAPD
jgi:aryl-alcohol dehydrogenase-like predicted oxidoreductase